MLTLGDASAVVPIWPCHAVAFAVFSDLRTQWRAGMGGATGMDYAAIPVVMDLHGVPPAERRECFRQLRVMEAAALQVIADARPSNPHRRHR